MDVRRSLSKGSPQKAATNQPRRSTRLSTTPSSTSSGGPASSNPERVTPKKRKTPDNTSASQKTPKKRKTASKTSKKKTKKPPSRETESEPMDTDEHSGESASDSLQQLLSHLGSFNEALSGGMNRGKYARLLLGLQQIGDDGAQMNALIELCDLLAMATEDSMGGFKANEFVPVLVQLLHLEHNPDIMLLATRALAYMVEAVPRSAQLMVGSDAITVFCSRMLSIEYIDVAEQSLQALFRLSGEHSVAILKSGGLMAVLAFLDFFSTATQRSCVATAANICRTVPAECFPLVQSALPNLCGILMNHDKQVVQSALLCYSRLTANFVGHKEEMSAIGSDGLVENLVSLVSGTAPIGSGVPMSICFGILTRICQECAPVAVSLVDKNIYNVLITTLDPRQAEAGADVVGSPMRSSLGTSPLRAYDNAALEDLLGALQLSNALLPALPQGQEVPKERKNKFIVPHKASKRSTKPSELAAIYAERSELIMTAGENLYGVLQTIFSSAVNRHVRELCLSTIVKILHFCSAEQLKELLREMGTSAFVAMLLGRSELAYVGTALHMADILMSKLPDIFLTYFYREGVFQVIETLAETPATSSLSPSSLTSGPSTPKGPSNSASMRKWIIKKAVAFCKAYASQKDGAAATTALQSMATAAEGLAAASTISEQRDCIESITHVLKDGMSTYEFLNSGLVNALLEYLTTGTDEEIVKKASLFVDISCELGERAVLSELLAHLQNTLARLENYVLFENSDSSTSSGIKFLTQPIKLHLERAPGETEMVDVSDKKDVVIEPLATVGAIEDFIMSLQRQQAEPPSDKKSLVDSLKSLRKSLRKSRDDGSGSSPSGSRSRSRSGLASLSRSGDVHDFTMEASQECGGDEVMEEASSARLHDLVLTIDGNKLHYKNSIVAELHRAFNEKLDAHIESSGGGSTIAPARTIWEAVHSIQYRACTSEEQTAPDSPRMTASLPTISPKGESRLLQLLHSDSYAKELGSCAQTSGVLRLLRVLHVLLEGLGLEELFVNSKIATKVRRQLGDAVSLCAGSLPTWCTHLAEDCPFLMPFEYRLQVFTGTALGIARALHALQQTLEPTSPDSQGDHFRVGRIQRQKVRVSRQEALKCAERVLELYAKSKTVLEIEFIGEEGTGTGPSLEFFTLVSHHLQREELDMWYLESTTELATSGESLRLAFNGGGLYPAPRQQDDPALATVLPRFRTLGRLLGKALLDSRQVDIHFAPPFLRWLLQRPLLEDDLEAASPQLGATVRELRGVVEQKEAILADGFTNDEEKAKRIAALMYRGGAIEALGLDFTFPGQPAWELKEGGSDIIVSIDNLKEYVDLVTQCFLVTGVAKQMAEVAEGLAEVLPLRCLHVFQEEELQKLLSGFDDDATIWERDAFLEAIVCDHHYSKNSVPVQYLADVVSQLGPDDKRNFVQFVTGTPRLPIGGFKSLSPPLTVVKKDTEGNSDSYLPSVMTCAKVLKLPAYSSCEAARDRILFAIQEGQASFTLS